MERVDAQTIEKNDNGTFNELQSASRMPDRAIKKQIVVARRMAGVPSGLSVSRTGISAKCSPGRISAPERKNAKNGERRPWLARGLDHVVLAQNGFVKKSALPT